MNAWPIKENSDMDDWVRVQELRWFDEKVNCLTVDDQRVFFVRLLDGSLSAYLAKCPHKAKALSGDDVNDAMVTCPLHAWHFDLERGGREVHGYADLPAVPMKIVDGTVYIQLSMPRLEERG